jgi:hypothetical protein
MMKNIIEKFFSDLDKNDFVHAAVNLCEKITS